MAKIGGVTVLILLLLSCALGPGKWQYRTGLGWRIDHVVGYFGFTLMFWLAWPRPLLVGGALMGTAMLLEALQALTPDRCCDLQAAFYGVAGALAAALCADVFTRTHRLMSGTVFHPAAVQCALASAERGASTPAQGTSALKNLEAVDDSTERQVDRKRGGSFPSTTQLSLFVIYAPVSTLI